MTRTKGNERAIDSVLSELPPSQRRCSQVTPSCSAAEDRVRGKNFSALKVIVMTLKRILKDLAKKRTKNQHMTMKILFFFLLLNSTPFFQKKDASVEMG